MLTYNEEEDLDDDDLEGSVGESRIFKEVFFGYDHDSDSNKGLISGTTDEYGLFKHTEDSLFSNSGNSAITSPVESCYAKEDLFKNSANWWSSGGDALFLRSDHDGNNEWMKLPTDELSYSEHYSVGSLPTSIVSGISRFPEAIISGFVTCRLVESSSQRITSSCFLIKRFAKNDVREVAASKTICSPVSGESSGNKLLVAIPIDNVANNTVSHHSDKKLKSSKFHNMPTAKVALDKDSTNNPKSFLRNYVQELLRDAGWRIGRRKREKSMGEFLYYSPWRRKPIRQFRRVWNLCGCRLFSETKIVLQEEKKQWADITQLCSDLYNTVLEIKREMSGKTSAEALAQRWYLLDPFVNMVFVDKKLNTLKAGKSVKARRSIVIGTFKENNVLLPSDYWHISGKRLEEESEDHPGDTSVVNGNALTVYDTKEAGTWCRKFSGNKRSRQSMTFSTACGADNTYNYFDGCLFEVPVSYEDTTNLICRGSETASPGQDDNKFSWSFDRYRSDNDENFDMEVQESKAVVSYEADKTFNEQIKENIGYQFENSYLVDVDIEVMVPRSYEPELCDIKKEDFPLEHTGAERGCIAVNEYANKSCRKSLRNSSYRGIGTNQDVELENVDSQNEMMHAHPTCQRMDIDPCFSALRKSKSLRSSTKKHGYEINSFKSEAGKKHKSKKGSCKLVPRYLIKGKKHNEGESSMLNARTVLSWLVDREVISLGDTIQCRSKMDDTVVKYGLVTRDGILCKCCGTLLSVSKFKRHAGFRLNHNLDLYMKSGKSFAICHLEAWSAEYKVRKSATQPVNECWMDLNDDKCGLCGDMGELICCDNCPSTFHQACLEKQELPEGNWYCMHCSCRVCGGLVDDSVPLKSHSAVMCLQCEHKYHRACLEENGDIGVPFDGSFCCQSCQEVYTGLNSCVGFVNHLSDGFCWTLLKCIYGDQRNHSAPDVALEAECNTKLAIALSIMEQCFLSIVDSRTGIDMIPHILYNMRSDYPRLNYNGFYTVVLETDDVVISVASIRIHGVTVAEMPLVATCINYQRQGMFRRLLHSIEELLKSFKVEKLVVSALPSLVETWTIGFGFTLMEDDERKSLKDFNLMVFPGTVWLKKHILETPKTLRGHRSSSIRDGRAETICFPKRPIIESQKHSFGRSSANRATKKMENRHMNYRNLQTEQDHRHGILYEHLLKLPWGEPDSSVGRIRVDVGSARENVFRMSQRAHASRDIC